MLRIEPREALVNWLHRSTKITNSDRGSTVRGFFKARAFGAFLWRLLAFIRGDAFGEGVAVDAEDGGCVREVLFVAREGLLDVELLEFAERFIQKDVTFEHFVDQAFEASMNQSSFPVSSL